MSKEQDFYKEIIMKIKKNRLSKEKITKLKNKLCSKHNLKKTPTDIQILLNAEEKDTAKLKKYLLTKPTRTISGVSVVAIMTKPSKCPHGKCSICPGGLNSKFGDVPQSYTGKEPATRRAIRNKYDPYLQVMNRLEQYIVTGHMPDKIELILMGGTFPSLTKRYKENFVKYSLKAMNDFSDMFFDKKGFKIKKFKEIFELPGDLEDLKRQKRIFQRLLKIKNKKTSLEKEQDKNDKRSKIKCVGLTIETRPDYGKLKHGNEMLRLGCTRVELGIQSVYENILKKINRGHTVKDSIESIAILKDLGFKLNFHVMPGLPEVNKNKDLKGLIEIFENPDFRPDMLKIYPCMVTKGTKLYDLYKKKKYDPITTKKAAELIAEFKRYVPEYCRIMRIQRDIPTYMTEAGVDRTNLRQYVHELMKEKDIECRCIRCREIGRSEKKGKVDIDYIPYSASQGTEFFISAEDEKNIYGFCRLRFPKKKLRKEIDEDTALIRELHVYGQSVSIGKKSKKIQHKGLGKKLLKFAEEQAKIYYKKKIVIISGIGVRNYYRKLGYKKQGPYMVKRL